MWPYLLLVLLLVSLSHQTPVRLMTNDDHNRSLLLERALQQVVNRPPASWMNDEANEIKRAAVDSDDAAAASFWKRSGGGEGGDDTSFWKRAAFDAGDNAGFWKRDASEFWKRDEPAAFWKRDQQGGGLQVSDALEIIRRYIELQKQRSKKSQQTAAKTRSYEEIDDNTRAGEIAAGAHKEERRRGEEQVAHPKFNPTGW